MLLMNTIFLGYGRNYRQGSNAGLQLVMSRRNGLCMVEMYVVFCNSAEFGQYWSGLSFYLPKHRHVQGFYVDLSFHRVPRNMCAQPHDA